MQLHWHNELKKKIEALHTQLESKTAAADK